jgi:hypothetical protein
VSGVNYLFRFEDPESKAAIYTAVLSVTSFTPNAAKWSAKLAGRQGQPIQLTLMRAVFTAGTITDGPFVATTKTTYTVGP